MKLNLKQKNNMYLLVAGLCLVVIVFDVVYLINKAKTNNNFDSISSNIAPSTKKPSPKAVASYSVPPLDPKYLIIPAIKVDARVFKISVNANKQIEAPSNVYDTAWYDSSSLPGQPGAMFIDGHVSSWTADGVFYNLKSLKPGDSITVVRGDNKSFTYVVNALKVYPYNNVNMQQVLAAYTPYSAGLNLMTCTGQVIKNTSEFNERLVVFSTLKT
jgi:sortase (surface protein transpeptidase)